MAFAGGGTDSQHAAVDLPWPHALTDHGHGRRRAVHRAAAGRRRRRDADHHLAHAGRAEVERRVRCRVADERPARVAGAPRHADVWGAHGRRQHGRRRGADAQGRPDVLSVPFVRQATQEFPAALASIRVQLPVDDGPIGVLGGSLGGAVALRTLADTEIPVFAGAVVNGAIRMRSVVDLFPGDYPYDAESEKAVDSLDFVAKAGVIATHAPLLVVSGELDHPALRADAFHLLDALGKSSELLSIPGLAHPLADEPGIEPAPQLPLAREVDAGLTTWFRRHLADAG